MHASDFTSVLTMNSEQLSRALNFLNKQKNRKFAVGVYAADLIPKTFTRPAAFIVNTDDYGQPGTHWIAVFIPHKGRIEFFDSYGLPPYIENHILFLRKRSWTHNDREIQSLTSTVCGHYCLLYLAARMNGISMQTFKKSFTKDLDFNDQLAQRCVRNMFKHAKLNTCKEKGLGQLCCSKI